MLSPAIRAKLRDPDYLELHLAAVASIAKVGVLRSYDAVFLQWFAAARHYLAQVQPDRLPDFVDAFAPLRPPAGFSALEITDLFDRETHQMIIAALNDAMAPSRLDQERELFGRDVVRDHPLFVELQHKLLDDVSNLVGCQLEAGYNFLSRYGSDGKCAPHLDQPLSMYTLDYCIDQSVEWPIYFSQPVEWPSVEALREHEAKNIRHDRTLTFKGHVLQPNNAVIFNGSSQWHYRDPIPAGGHCDLLFFHYFPKGAEGLVRPRQWAQHIGIDELAPLCDLIAENENQRTPV